MTQLDRATQMMDDIDPKLLDFLHHKVNSFVKWDLVRFFHDNPHAADTAENIARYIGRAGRSIEEELVGLVKSSVLYQSNLSGFTVYTLANDQSVRQLITDFVSACSDRQFRVKAIYHVIRAMR